MVLTTTVLALLGLKLVHVATGEIARKQKRKEEERKKAPTLNQDRNKAER
jgi:hypothetical protein